MEAKVSLITYPFTFDPSRPFVEQASDWIADVFYEVLPEAGFEVRDEQIYMAFQLEKAYAEKKTILAEAGVGTGKTLAYLLYAVTYARYTRKPAIIACADESLIEQLVKPEGDIAKLARYLDLQIDARMGKSPEQFICLNKLDQVRMEEERYQDIYESLPAFVSLPGTMQTFEPYGNRKDYPQLSDQEWSRLSWDVFQDCLVCAQRHRCGQTISRDYYRKATDLIICSHDFYMEHIWTYESKKREGQLPLLPEHSSVVFDEGHLLEQAAQNALTYSLKHSVFEQIILRLLEGEVRESLAMAVDQAIECSEGLFELLTRNSQAVSGSERREIHMTDRLKAELQRFSSLLSTIEEELVFEDGLFSLNEYQLRIVEEHLEMLQTALALFRQPGQFITWLREDQDGLTLVMMPKGVKEILRERVFSKKMPIVFSSATLSAQDSFQYMADSLGLEDYLSFTVPSPYHYTEQMRTALYQEPEEQKSQKVLELLEASGGKALVLFPSREELDNFQSSQYGEVANRQYTMLYEGTAEISHLISRFQQDESSVLCAVSLWEGLDIPGPALSHVIIWDLPFPPADPVFNAKRRDASSALHDVELPYMLLRLRQGIGRLIRSHTDNGIVSILSSRKEHEDVQQQVAALLGHFA